MKVKKLTKIINKIIKENELEARVCIADGMIQSTYSPYNVKISETNKISIDVETDIITFLENSGEKLALNLQSGVIELLDN